MTAIDNKNEDKPSVILITGPTASGKSETALELCKVIGGEIVSADSMQIYRGLDIGTAKVSLEQRKEVRHHLIDICDPGDYFSVAAFKEAADTAIRDIIQRGHQPVICGGTGQYLSALMLGISYTPVEVDHDLRARLNKKADSDLAKLWTELNDIDPQSALKISRADRKRIVRALEIYYQTGLTRSKHDENSLSSGPDYKFHAFCLNHERTVLYDRINRRVDIMIEEGLLSEVKSLLKKDIAAGSTCLQAIGYKELIAYLHDELSLVEAVGNIKQASRRYAKRQLTWFRKMKGLIWLENRKPAEACRDIREYLSADN